MIRALVENTFDQFKKYVELAGTSTDSKPTAGIITGSKFYEVDTGVEYAFDEVSSSWNVVGISTDEIKAEIDAWLDDHPEATTTVEDGAISYAKLNSALKETVDDVAELKEEMPKKADIDGYYEEMTVGDAEQLVATVGITDKVPYNFRTSGGSADIGDREVDKLVGGTVAWNQLQRKPSEGGVYAYQYSGSISYDGDTIINTAQSANQIDVKNTTAANLNQKIAFKKDHVYLFACDVKCSEAVKIKYYFKYTLLKKTTSVLTANTWEHHELLGKWTQNNEDSFWDVVTDSNVSIGATLSVKNVLLIDLTQMFGSTIVDYIYSLETATAGAGIAWFRKLFPNPYYAYNAGELMSVQAASHKMVGFNAYNPTTGKAKVVGGYEYEIVGTYTALSMNGETITPVSGKFTPAENGEITVTGGDSTTTCIHLVWDGERDGEYEAYKENVYPLDDSLTLRGIPKLDSNNSLYYDGDTYESDGTVTRKYGIVDLGTLTWIKVVGGGVAGQFYAEKEDFDGAGDANGEYLICTKFLGGDAYLAQKDGVISTRVGTYKRIWVHDNSYDSMDSVQFKAAMNGVYLIYKLATPTTESADPYQNPQIVNDFGTEEYTDAAIAASTRDVAIPVGHETVYRANLRAKLEMAPNSPEGDGDYLLRQEGGVNTYIPYIPEVPSGPTEDGTYILKCTVSGGEPTLVWEEVT